MNLLTLPLRTLRRKAMRTALLTVVFAAGICSVVALNYVSKAVGDSMEKKLTAYGANILLQPKVDTLAVGYGGFSLGNVSVDVKSLTREQVDKVRTIELHERIAAVAPKFIALTEVKGQHAAIIGVDWPEELMIKNYWGFEGKTPEAPGEVLVGSRAAATLGLKVGDRFGVQGRDFTVSGLLTPTGSEDDNVLFAGIEDLQAAMGKPGQIHFAEVAALCSGCPIDEIVTQIQQKIPDVDIVAMQKIVKARMYTVHFVQHLALIVSVILLLTACFMIALSLLASVNERKHEIGVLRSLGYSRGSVFSIFCLEALAIGMGAGVAGFLGGFGVSHSVMDMLELGKEATMHMEWWHLGVTLAGVAVISCLSSVIPAWKAANTDPSQALVML
ncbi:ABC transporter permease [Fundidesulfovibrio agrisoli]|uniref:ABC transporter permease n=1 Tax=Fundidesulfovibrio agrisoli TaxID=2922717 RepID=UPI001FADE5DB